MTHLKSLPRFVGCNVSCTGVIFLNRPGFTVLTVRTLWDEIIFTKWRPLDLKIRVSLISIPLSYVRQTFTNKPLLSRFQESKTGNQGSRYIGSVTLVSWFVVGKPTHVFGVTSPITGSQ